jgi:thiamine biosynthesis lipoprotein
LFGILWGLFRPGLRGEEPREISFYALGTVCRIRAAGGDPKNLDASLTRAEDRVEEIDRRLSAHRDDSDLARIAAAAGRGTGTAPETVSVLRIALEVAQASGGAFDPTVAPLVRLWGIGTPRARIPADREIARARALLGWRSVRLIPDDGARGENRVLLPRPGMGLDLGGVAKGYAADEVARILASRGVSSALIDLGGNLVTRGSRPDGQPWRLGIQDPERPRGKALAVLDTAEGEALVTSGAYERSLTVRGHRYGHILDPGTGRPADGGTLSVTILGPESARADALSTALFVLGPTRGIRTLRAFPSYEAAFVLPGNRIVATAGLADRLVPIRPGLRIERIPWPNDPGRLPESPRVDPTGAPGVEVHSP